MKYLLLIIFFPVICCDNGKRIVETKPEFLVDTIYVSDSLWLIVEGDYTRLSVFKTKDINHWVKDYTDSATVDYINIPYWIQDTLLKYDSINYGTDDSGKSSLVDWNGISGTDTIPVQFGGKLIIDTRIFSPNYDTSRVLMLVCDTSNTPNMLIGYFDEFSKAMNERRGAWWQFGYEVRDYSKWYTYEGYYLDQDKKPLKKSIIVWDTKKANTWK